MKKTVHSKVESEIAALEKQVMSSKEKLAELRRSIPPKHIKNYKLQGSFGEDIKLASLFGNKNEMILIHNMGTQCSYCTLWADGFNGIIQHLENRASFVVESGDDPFTQRCFAQDRGWKFRMISSRGTSLKQDLGFGSGKSPMLGISVLKKNRDGKIQKISGASLGPGDNYCIAWDLFDLLPGGCGQWGPKYHYDT